MFVIVNIFESKCWIEKVLCHWECETFISSLLIWFFFSCAVFLFEEKLFDKYSCTFFNVECRGIIVTLYRYILSDRVIHLKIVLFLYFIKMMLTFDTKLISGDVIWMTFNTVQFNCIAYVRIVLDIIMNNLLTRDISLKVSFCHDKITYLPSAFFRMVRNTFSFRCTYLSQTFAIYFRIHTIHWKISILSAWAEVLVCTRTS